MTAYGWRHARARSRRGVSGVIATILLLAITLVLVVVLSLFRPNLSSASPQIYINVLGSQTEQAWGDPTDCSNTTSHAQCNALPAIFLAVKGFTPSYLAVNLITLVFQCNGTQLLKAPLNQLEVVPGSGSSPGTGSPTIQNCGTWNWGGGAGFDGTFFNRLLYYQQVTPNAPGVAQGDTLVVYSHPQKTFLDYQNNSPDDDYHGGPAWCFNVPGACTIYLTYQSGGTQPLLLSVSLYGMVAGV